MKNESVNETRRESMSMHPQPIPAIPEETVRIAHAVLPKGNVWMQMRDELGTLYEDHDFQDLFMSRGQPAETPWRRALVTIMQYGEGLTDRQAADAVRTRIDWKYVLSLELTDPGFDFSILSEFRSRLLAHEAERRLFDLLLEQCRVHGWIKARGQQRTDSTHVLAAVRTLRHVWGRLISLSSPFSGPISQCKLVLALRLASRYTTPSDGAMQPTYLVEAVSARSGRRDEANETGRGVEWKWRGGRAAQ